jgi:sulfur-oxidizing protein SoxX
MIVVFLAMFMGLGVAPACAQATIAFQVRGDTIPEPLVARAADASNGARLMADRHRSLCVLCHAGPFSEPHMQGNIAPNLKGLGSRLSAAQIRLRVANIKAINPDSLMPAYLAIADGLDIAEAWRGKTILDPGEVEDIVAYLATLKE